MRIPVFARGSNPAVDRRILKKSLEYAQDQVNRGRADWVDPADPRQGIICREMIYFGPRELPPEPVKPGANHQLPIRELFGLQFRAPATAGKMPRVFPRFFGKIPMPVVPFLLAEQVSAGTWSPEAAEVEPTRPIATSLPAGSFPLAI